MIDVFRKKIEAIRTECVLKGKRTKRFAEKAKGETAPKYTELDNVDQSGSAAVGDCMYLYQMVKKYRPRVIFEIGTWFGSTAWVMAQAMNDADIKGKIYTCDKNDLFVSNDKYPFIIRMKMQSTNALKKLKKQRTKIDLFFADGGLKDKDAKLIDVLSRNRLLFFTHDYKPGEKGYKNIEKIRKLNLRLKITEPSGYNKAVAMLEEV